VLARLPSTQANVRTPKSTSTADPASQNGAFEVKLPAVPSTPNSSNWYSPFKSNSNGLAAESAASAAMALAAPRPTTAMSTTSIAGLSQVL
jgi:hypothetical protein